jgi:hypothetical protein
MAFRSGPIHRGQSEASADGAKATAIEIKKTVAGRGVTFI